MKEGDGRRKFGKERGREGEDRRRKKVRRGNDVGKAM